MKYLFVKNGNLEGFFGDGGYVKIINNPVSIFRSQEYNEQTDNLYQIGSELKMKVVLEPAKVYRADYSSTINTVRSLKDDLSVGEYRG